MTLHEFLKKVQGVYADINVIEPEDALAAVQENGNALRYVDTSIFEPVVPGGKSCQRS